MSYEEWEQDVLDGIKNDPVWQFIAYRKALFLYDLVWRDCEALQKDARGRAVIEQIIRSSGSISANIEEGHGRGYGRDRDHFLRIALGSARETEGWCYRAHALLAPEVVQHRVRLLDEIIALLVTELARQRQYR